MIKLFKVKEKQRELAENANGKPEVKKQSAVELRLHKGVELLSFLSIFVLSILMRLQRSSARQRFTTRISTWKEMCLNILREDWKPVLNINTIIYGEPNHEDPLNHDAAAVLSDDPKMFESNVRSAMSGVYVGQTYFKRCM